MTVRNYLKIIRESVSRHARMRRDRDTLNEMSDAMLADMGISRSMIDYYTTPRAPASDLVSWR